MPQLGFALGIAQAHVARLPAGQLLGGHFLRLPTFRRQLGELDLFLQMVHVGQRREGGDQERPLAVSRTPESRSSMALSSSTRGQVQDAPSSREVIASTCPKGHTWCSRPPDQTTHSSPLLRRATVGQP